MSKTLYRLYRPRIFAEVVNQKHIIETLTSELKNERVAHAYLFTGPRGVGKTTVARIFAQAVNCTKRTATSEACQKCEQCKSIHQGAIDLIEIDAASHTQVDHVREHIIPNAHTAPTISRYKVFIIDEVHMLSISAFNALLKLLEEPPETVIFILATTEVHRVPQTIISRCQRFDFHRLTVPAIIERLKFIGKKEAVIVEESVLRMIAITADGSARDAEGLFGQVLSLGEKNITEDIASIVLPRSNSESFVTLLRTIQKRDLTAALDEIEVLTTAGVVMTRFISDWLEFLRQVLLAQLNALAWQDMTVADAEQIVEIQQLTQKLTAEGITKIIESFQKRQRAVGEVSQPQFPIELALVELIGVDGQTIKPSPKPVATNKKIVNVPKKRDTNKPIVEIKPSRESVAITPSADITLKDVKKIWTQVARDVTKKNKSLGMLLKAATLTGVSDGNHIVLGFGFKLHRDRVMSPDNRERITQLIDEAMGQRVVVEAIVDQKLQAKSNITQPTDSEEEDIGDMVMKTFGNDTVSN